MEPEEILSAMEQLDDVPAERRADVMAAAIGLAFGRIQQRGSGFDREASMAGVLAAACDAVAAGPAPQGETKTARDWMVELLGEAKGALL